MEERGFIDLLREALRMDYFKIDKPIYSLTNGSQRLLQQAAPMVVKDLPPQAGGGNAATNAPGAPTVSTWIAPTLPIR